uniref:Uncharacterized protein n=1 Tax=Chrysotila carterae TaxID=13221 RepID=A0A7S4BJE0_CHRCT
MTLHLTVHTCIQSRSTCTASMHSQGRSPHACRLTPANADKAIRILRGGSSTPDSPINKLDSADSIADTIPQPRTPGAGRAMTPSRGGGATPPRWSRSNNDYGAFAAQASTPVTRALGPRGSNVGRPNTAFAPSPAGLSLGAGSPLRRSGTAAAPPLSIWTGQQPRSPTKPSYGAGFSRTPSKDITQGRWRSESVWGSSPMRR